MSPVTHFLTGWVIASVAALERRERAIITVAAVIPDIDGLGIVPELLTRHSQHPLLWFSQYHHVLHTLLFAVVVSVSAAIIANRKLTALMSFVAFHLHLLEDLIGSRGPDGFNWPIPYLHPFTSRGDWTWHGQWALNAWPNIALTVGLLCVTVWFAALRGYSPVNMFSPRADRAVIRVLRKRIQLARS